MATYKGTGIVWDAEKKRPLWNFNKGEYTTEDKREQSILANAGFIGDFDDEIVIIEDYEEQVRLHAKALGIKSWHVKNIDKLKVEIAEKEGN